MEAANSSDNRYAIKGIHICLDQLTLKHCRWHDLSHLCTIPIGISPTDILHSSPILHEGMVGGGDATGGASASGGGFEFGTIPVLGLNCFVDGRRRMVGYSCES